MKFSPVKEEVQHSLQALDTSRQFLARDLTAQGNHMRAYLYEFGITINKGRKSLREAVPIVLEDSDTRLPQCLKSTFALLWKRFTITESQLKATENAKAG